MLLCAVIAASATPETVETEARKFLSDNLPEKDFGGEDFTTADRRNT
ncbi:MAG: hypothetical protein IKV57_01315 [Clostridia bacterium]|nr:hypothetical protein [Clostridia bacterium]